MLNMYKLMHEHVFENVFKEMHQVYLPYFDHISSFMAKIALCDRGSEGRMDGQSLL